MRFAAVLVFIVECVLSHTPGDRSGEESAWLARTTGIKENWLRRAAHMILFFFLSLFAVLGFGSWAFALCVIWSVLDEVTKVWIPGRHCSWFDVGLNMLGTGLGLLFYVVL